jgi:amino acid permease
MIIISAFSAAIADLFLASRPFYRRGSHAAFLRMQGV